MAHLSRRPVSLFAAVCRSCPSRNLVHRSIATSATQSPQLPPESPNYVDFPHPELPRITRPKPVKGILPIPRDVLKWRRSNPNHREKRSGYFAQEATKGPVAPKRRTDEYLGYKDRLAASRRENLREGLKALVNREGQANRQERQRQKAKKLETKEARNRPVADDEVYNQVSVHPSITAFLNGGSKTQPRSKQEVAARKSRYLKNAAQKNAERMRDLGSLYMQARTFITTTADLDEAIETTFAPEESAQVRGFFQGSQTASSSAWKKYHDPPTVEKLLATSASDLRRERLKRIAEELTGGRL